MAIVHEGSEWKIFDRPKRGASVKEWYDRACDALTRLPIWNENTFNVTHESVWTIKIFAGDRFIVINKTAG